MIIVGLIVCLLHTFTSSDAAFTWIRHDASVDFIQGQTAKLVWTVDVGIGYTWAKVTIYRNKVKSNAPEDKIIDLKKSDGVKNKHLSGRDADIDLVVQGTSNVVNVTFTLHNLVQTTDDKYYTIELTNSNIDTESQYTYLRVFVLPGTPVLQLDPNKPVFCKGADTINITCNGVTGHPTLTNLAFWQNDSSISMLNVTTSGNYTKAVLSHALTQPGTLAFLCKATNAGGSSPTSNVVTITVKDPPVITNCTNNTVVEKENLVWTCDVSGSQPLTISWFKGNTNTVIQSGKSLNIATVSRADSGMYRFTASNGEGCPTASKTVYLDVQFLPGTPVLQLQPDKSVFCRNDTINITCNGLSGHPPPKLTFLQNDSTIGMLNGTTSGNYTKAVLSHALTQPGTFTFSCNATNAAGSSPTSNVVTITVKDPPVIAICVNETVLEKTNLTMTCDVSGSQPLTISWLKGNNNTVFQSGKSLSIVTVSRADAGMYRLTASNGGECATASKTVYIDVQSLPGEPVLQLHPNNPVFCQNDTINITCNGVIGHPTLTNLAFLKNDSAINNVTTSGNYTKAILSHALTQPGTFTYSCKATNAAGSSPTSNVVTITVKDPPVITSCTNKTAVEKDNLTWTCDVSGSLPLNTSWFKGNTSTVIHSGKSLNITAVNRTDSGMYRFTASNGGECPPASKTVYLDVQYKPEQLSVDMAQNAFIDINEGQSVNITCSAKGKPEPYYYWVFYGRPLSSLRNDTITISNAAKGNAGKYTCTAVNTVGYETIAVTVRVHYIEEATCDATPYPVKENETLALNCSAAGYPQVNYTWTLPAKVINQPIVIEKATTSLNGVNMTCKAMNSRGNKTCTKTITVHYKPRDVQVVPASVPSLNISGSFNLTCNASSNPDGIYTWSKNGITLDGKTNRVLTIDNITSQHAGEYTCTVTNSEGSDASNNVTINVNYAPEMKCNSVLNFFKNTGIVIECEKLNGFHGFPTPSYTTLFNGTSYNASISITKDRVTKALDGLVIQCSASNEFGSASCNTTLQLKSRVELKPYRVSGSCRFMNYPWVKGMDDINSSVFKKHESILRNLLWKVFETFAKLLKIISLLRGSVIVNFQLEFTANVSDPLLPLKEALNNSGGALGGYSIDPNSIKQEIYAPPPTTSPTTTSPTTPPKVESGELSTEVIIGIAIGCVVFVILVIILLVYCCYCKKRRECKDDAFAENGENVVPMRGIYNRGSSHSPSTYAKHGPGANGNNNAGNGEDVYAQVDKSKKKKKPAGSNENEVTYAVLEYGRADNKSGDAQLAHMPSSGKEPEKYESNYAEITGVIRSNETPKENESADNSNKNEKDPENVEKESEAEEQAKDKNQDGSTTSQTVDNAVKNDNASGSQVNVETKGTSSTASQYADWQSTKDRDHTTLTNVSM